jgi:hypothetical protein
VGLSLDDLHPTPDLKGAGALFFFLFLLLSLLPWEVLSAGQPWF